MDLTLNAPTWQPDTNNNTKTELLDDVDNYLYEDIDRRKICKQTLLGSLCWGLRLNDSDRYSRINLVLCKKYWVKNMFIICLSPQIKIKIIYNTTYQ